MNVLDYQNIFYLLDSYILRLHLQDQYIQKYVNANHQKNPVNKSFTKYTTI